ncbi:MAG TPA: hypothetical protein VJM32_02845 [Candidatus Saccharimonadales bacterium]|nr:hypothetical protein [Candidatus Saccharimonadales bacterium]
MEFIALGSATNAATHVIVDLSEETPQQRTAVVNAIGAHRWSYRYGDYSEFTVVVHNDTAAEQGLHGAWAVQQKVLSVLEETLATPN